MKFVLSRKKEIIDKTDYNVGNILLTLLNEFNFQKNLINQKDYNLLKKINYAYQEIALDDLKLLNGELMNLENPTSQTEIIENVKDKNIIMELHIENNVLSPIKLNNEEFKQLVKLIYYAQIFLNLDIKTKNRFNNFMNYFNTILNYEMPKYKLQCPKVINESFKNLLEINKNNIKNITKRSDKEKADYTYKAIIEEEENTITKLNVLNKRNKSIFSTEYECNNINDFILASLHYIFSNNIAIKKCINCGRFFIPKSNSQKSCNNIRPKLDGESIEEYDKIEETCSQYNSRYLTYHNKSDVDAAKKRVKARIQKRIRENKEEPKYLEQWKKALIDNQPFFPDDRKYVEWILKDSDIHKRR